MKPEVSVRLQSANKCFYGLGKIVSSEAISTYLRIRMYLILLRPISLYEAETWLLRKADEQRLAVFERKVLRKIYGAYFDAHIDEWRVLHNDQLENFFQQPYVIKKIEKNRLM